MKKKKRNQAAHRKPRKQWDETHKFLFADAESIYQLLQFVDDDWITSIRPENITIVSNEFIERELGCKNLKKLMRKISDIVAKISFRYGNEEKTVYIILEHQSTVDYSMSRRLFEYPVIDVHRLPHEKILKSHGRVAAYFYLARYNKDLNNEDNCAEFTKHLLNILQHDTGEKVKESLLIMSDVLYNTHISETNVNDYTMKEVIDMITKEGIEILFPWQLRIYKEVKAQVKQETQEEIQEGRQEGRAEGHIEERRKNARSMFSKGFSAHDIQDVTGLSEDEIRTLQNGSGKNGSR